NVLIPFDESLIVVDIARKFKSHYCHDGKNWSYWIENIFVMSSEYYGLKHERTYCQASIKTNIYPNVLRKIKKELQKNEQVNKELFNREISEELIKLLGKLQLKNVAKGSPLTSGIFKTR
ncbi:7349_t:CDS:2, partial [Paraglomus occultum]